jgi:hypothetical protein
MPKKSDSQEAIGRFWDAIASHMEDNRSIFLGSRELTRAEADKVMRQARRLAKESFDAATNSRAEEAASTKLTEVTS